jgi:hypothetical protein
MDAPLEQHVWVRAASRCEYCRVPLSAYLTPFQIDHVIALKHAGPTVPENFALACFHCNLHKGPNIAGIDPATSKLTRLFHPRQDDWMKHFALNRDGTTKGITDVGRTTIAVLNMNEPIVVTVRAFLIDEGDALAQLLR